MNFELSHLNSTWLLLNCSESISSTLLFVDEVTADCGRPVTSPSGLNLSLSVSQCVFVYTGVCQKSTESVSVILSVTQNRL